jgi:regulator of cell morphogenesis and NO signaling
MQQEHESVSKVLNKTRELTNDYIPPDKACITHRVTLSLLKELDNDLVQHLYLENQILFPKAIAMEKELLLTK